MNIGLDYDDTYTRDPRTWDKVLDVLRKANHKIYVVTWRSSNESLEVYEALDGKVHGIFFTDRKAKEKFMYAQGIRIDVMIDDNPGSWTTDMVTYSPSGLWS